MYNSPKLTSFHARLDQETSDLALLQERFDAGQSKCNRIQPKSRSFRRANSPEELLVPLSSPVLLCRVPSPRSVRGIRESSRCHFCPKTEHNTPRLLRPGTPALHQHQVMLSPTSFPNYMVRTTSSVAKVKSWRKAMEEDSNGASMAGSKHGRPPMAASEAGMDLRCGESEAYRFSKLE